MAKRKKYSEIVSEMPIEDRLQKAKEIIRNLTFRVQEVISLNATNQILTYSDKVARKIPESYGASAYNDLQKFLFQLELIKVTSLWDKPDSNAVSIPTAVLLIDSPEALYILQQEHFGAHAGRGVRLLNKHDDTQMQAEIARLAAKSQENFAAEQASRVEEELKEIFEYVREFSNLKLFESVINERDKIAHSVTLPKREAVRPVPPMKYGNETELLNKTIEIIERLYCWVNGTSFNISEDVFELYAERHSEFWLEQAFSVEPSIK